MMRAALATTLIALLPLAAGAQTAVETSPAPEARPLDRPDPEDREDGLLPQAEVLEDPVPTPDTPPTYTQLAEDDAAFAACLARLDEYGTVYTVADPVTTANDQDCGIARPVDVTEILPGVALRPDAVMRCETAARTAEWMAGSVQPAAALMEERGPVVAVDHGSTYICRRRNNAATGKLSEHSFGNAIDVMGFRFEDGSSLVIEPRADAGTIEEAFQRAVRGTACLSFTTVLGPGTDAAHADHLHLDVVERRGGYRICQ